MNSITPPSGLPQAPLEILTEADYSAAYFAELRAACAPTAEFPWGLGHGRVHLAGPLADAVEWIEAANPRSMRLGAFAAALVGFGAGLARRVYVRWSFDPATPPTAIQQPIVLIARTGAGKDVPLRACQALVRLAGRTAMPNLPFHPNRLYAELCRSDGVVGLCLDEVDATFAQLHTRNEHSAAKEAALKTLLSAKGYLHPPAVGARNVEREAINEALGEGTWERGIDRPAVAWFGVATPAAWDRMAGNVAGGLVGRMLVLDGGTVLESTSFPSASPDGPPQSVREWFDALHPAAVAEAIDFTIPSDPDCRVADVVVEPDSLAIGAYTFLAAELTDESNAAFARGDTQLADLLARGIESVCRIAALLALGGAKTYHEGTIEARHMFAAYAIVRWAIGRTASETAARGDQSDLAKAIRLIRTRLSRPNVVRGVETPWHFGSRLTRNVEAQGQPALKALCQSGEVRQDGRRYALEAHLNLG